VTSNGFVPNTTVTILRTPTGEDTPRNAWGDRIDTDTPVKTGVPASLLDVERRIWVPAENRSTVIVTTRCRLRGDVDVRERDRIRDEATSRVYVVEEMNAPRSPFGRGAIRLTLAKVG
jgi:hypothetical protein